MVLQIDSSEPRRRSVRRGGGGVWMVAPEASVEREGASGVEWLCSIYSHEYDEFQNYSAEFVIFLFSTLATESRVER